MKRLFSKSVCIYALGLMCFWPLVCTSSLKPLELLGDVSNLGILLHSIMTCLAAVAAVVAFSAYVHGADDGIRRVFAIGAGAGLASGVLYAGGNLIPVIGGLQLMGIASSILLGVYLAALGMVWAHTLFDLDVRDRLVSLALSTIGCVLVFGIMHEVKSLVVPITWLMIAASGIIWYSAHQRICLVPSDESSATARPAHPVDSVKYSRSLSFALYLTLTAFMVGNSILRQLFYVNGLLLQENRAWESRSLLIALTVCALVWVLWGDHRGRTPSYPFAPFVLVCIVTLYCIVLFFEVELFLCDVIILPTRPLSLIMVFALSCDIARERGKSFDFAAVLFVVAACLSLVVGGCVGLVWTTLGEASYVAPIALATALALTLGFSYSMMLKGFSTSALAGAIDGAGDSSSRVALFADSGVLLADIESQRLTPSMPVFASLGEHYGLSEREMQILEMLSQGDSRKKIAETLYLSINSVQTYTKNLYRKLDVHTRQEVIDLVRAELDTYAQA